MGQGDVGRVPDYGVVIWDRGRLGECQTMELPGGDGEGGRVPDYGVAMTAGPLLFSRGMEARW